MVKLHHYYKEKFTAFTSERQEKAILELLTALENNISDAGYRHAMIPHIRECLSWSAPALQKKFHALSGLDANSLPHDILKPVMHLLRLYKPTFDEAETEISRFDGVDNKAVKVPYPLTVILDNLRSAYNVGSIFRTAECVQSEKLILCGITPTPPHPRVVKTSMGTEDRIIWSYHTHTEEVIRQLKHYGMPVIALETASNAKSLFSYKPTKPVAVILGNEALGIEQDILKLADEVLSIPVCGWKNSLNVSNAFALAAYHLSGITTKL